MYIKRESSRLSQMDEQGKEEADQRVLLFKRCECENMEHHTHEGRGCTEQPGINKYYCRGRNGGVLRICDKCHLELVSAHSRALIS
jgi:hypothetical protein